MKVSIIVPVYNVERYLSQCLESLVNQKFNRDDFEIILVDDGSTDSSIEICNFFELEYSNIKLIRKANEGLGMARNTGLSVAKGNYIMFVDSDDYVSNTMIGDLYKVASTEGADIVYGGVIEKFVDKEIDIPVSDKYIVHQGSTACRELLFDLIGTLPESKKDTAFPVSVWKALFNKDIFDKYDVRFVSEREFISEDVIFNISYFPYTEKIVLVPELYYYYRVNDKSLSKSYRMDRFVKSKYLYNEVKKLLVSYYPNHIEEIDLRSDRMLLAYMRVQLFQIVNTLRYKEAISEIRKILNDEVVTDILDRYNYGLMPTKYRLFYFFAHNRYDMLTYFICKIKR